MTPHESRRYWRYGTASVALLVIAVIAWSYAVQILTT